ncbi:MAG: SDR family NAD(P)-dependent oxidoreductase [Kitasatospora sp.]|jgi:NAD(P)-dependent dehydrogenase (short-subunit alcohol dehydrogenase family)|nr:SDR family NAD(P)-dependent oxidoreductase [Kitasatospora sp.]
MSDTGRSAAGEPRATWREADVPGQDGRTAVVTGANSGIGFETARVLAERGAAVALACRDPGTATEAAARISARIPGASLSVVRLDLASLASVREAAAELRGRHDRLDLVINNAGLMMPPYGRTEDGFEQQLGINHLGHFALTGLLLDRMLAVPGSRVVSVSSNAHRMGRIDFGNLHWERGYRRSAAYGQSKLANLVFTYELQRRLAAAGAATAALAAHPGLSRTELVRHLPGWMRLGSRLAPSQSSAMGALPTLRAATDPAAMGGQYYGPAGRGEFTGPARRVESSARSHDAETARRLWDESERLTGVTYPV